MPLSTALRRYCLACVAELGLPAHVAAEVITAHIDFIEVEACPDAADAMWLRLPNDRADQHCRERLLGSIPNPTDPPGAPRPA
jgi:hypothetical protein